MTTRRLSLLLALLPILALLPTPAAAAPGPGVECFEATGHCAVGLMAATWREAGGLERFGYPISAQIGEVEPGGRPRIVQYFERARLEMPAPDRLELGLLGREVYERRYPGGAPGAPDTSGLCFPETGQCAGGLFARVWAGSGGVARHGFPISPEFVEEGKTVQYFERARFELAAADRVDFGLLGHEAYAVRYPGQMPGPPRLRWPAPRPACIDAPGRVIQTKYGPYFALDAHPRIRIALSFSEEQRRCIAGGAAALDAVIDLDALYPIAIDPFEGAERERRGARVCGVATWDSRPSKRTVMIATDGACGRNTSGIAAHELMHHVDYFYGIARSPLGAPYLRVRGYPDGQRWDTEPAGETPRFWEPAEDVAYLMMDFVLGQPFTEVVNAGDCGPNCRRVRREPVTDPADLARLEQAAYYLSLVPYAPAPGSPAIDWSPWDW